MRSDRRPWAGLLFGMCGLGWACSEGSESFSLGEVLWRLNLPGTDAESLQMAVGPQSDITLAALQNGIVDVGGGTRCQNIETPTVLLARFRIPSISEAVPEHVWSQCLAGGIDASAPLALTVTPNGTVVLALSGWNGGIVPTDPDLAESWQPSTERLPGTVLATFSGAAGEHLWIDSMREHVLIPQVADLTVAHVAMTVRIVAVGTYWPNDDGTAEPPPGLEQGWLYAEAFPFHADTGLEFGATDVPLPMTWHGHRVVVDAHGDFFVAGARRSTVAAERAESKTGVVQKLDDSTLEPLWDTVQEMVYVGPSLEIAVSQDPLFVEEATRSLVVAGNFVPPGHWTNAGQPLNEPSEAQVTVALISAETGIGDASATTVFGKDEGSNETTCTGLAVGRTGSVFVGGTFQGSLGVRDRKFFSEIPAMLLLKLDENGQTEWGRYSGYTNDVVTSDIAVDDNGNAIVAGLFKEAGQSNGAPKEIFVVKFGP